MTRENAAYLVQLREDLDRTETDGWDWARAAAIVAVGVVVLYMVAAGGTPFWGDLIVAAVVGYPALALVRNERARRRERRAILQRIAWIEEGRGAPEGPVEPRPGDLPPP